MLGRPPRVVEARHDLLLTVRGRGDDTARRRARHRRDSPGGVRPREQADFHRRLRPEPRHLVELGVGEQEHAGPLRNAVHADVEPLGLLEHGLEAPRPFRARDLHPVLRSVGEPLVGGRVLVQVGRREPGCLEELPRRRHGITLKGEQVSADHRAMVVAAAVSLALLAGAVLFMLRSRRRDLRSQDHELLARGFPGAMLIFDRRLRHSSALGRGVAAMGVDPVGKTLHEAFPVDVCQVFSPAYRAALEGVESQLELPVGGRDWLITVSPLGTEAGLLVATDVTERKRRERRLNDRAARDELTGAWNARRLYEELDWLNRSGGAGSLLMLDLDGFKRVNDTLGHVAGNELLRRVSTAVQSCVRRADLVARMGGDEFAVLLAGATPGEAEEVAEKIRGAVAAVWPLGTRGGVSIGISTAGHGAGDALGRADRAMYADKRRAPERLAS